MARFDETRAECFVFTFKEGLLSAVAHDLKLRVGRFSVEIEEAAASPRVEARFDARSLSVACAMKDGHEAPGALSDKDKVEIARNIDKDVLDPARYPEIRFVSTAIVDAPGGKRVRGTLTLHGRSREISVDVVETASERRVECELDQPDFGIKPYSAMLGTLKIKPHVRVRLAVPR